MEAAEKILLQFAGAETIDELNDLDLEIDIRSRPIGPVVNGVPTLWRAEVTVYASSGD